GGEPFRGDGERLVPPDLAKLAAAPLADTQQRLVQTGGRVMLHDAGRALGAQHALVDRVLGIAFDEPDLAVLEVDPDPAAAGAHVAGRRLDLVGDERGRIDDWIGWHEAPSAGAGRPAIFFYVIRAKL